MSETGPGILVSLAAKASTVAPAAGGPLIGRRTGQRLARRELAEVSFWQRVIDRLARLFSNAQTAVPGGWFGLVALAVIAVLVVTAIIFWVRPARTRRDRTRSVLSGESVTARDYRLAAERLAADGDYAGAIVQTVRAIAADLDERGVLPPKPGRTADELAAEAGRELPSLAADLRAATGLFDDVRYGDRQASLAGYELVSRVDADVLAARPAREPAAPALAGSPAGSGAPW
jgi:type II secretory pathway pseudopilin PulG